MISEHLQRIPTNTLKHLGQIIFYKLSRRVLTHVAAPSDSVILWSPHYKKLKGIDVAHLATLPKESSMNQ
jgi:hypothetical protein